MEEVKFRATKLFNFSSSSENENIPIAQCIIDTTENTCLYILYKKSISILNITNGKTFEIQSQFTFLPYITYDSAAEIPVPYICTEKGQLCTVFENEITLQPQIIGQNPFIVYNDRIIIGDQKSGLITMFDINDQNQVKLVMNKSDKFLLNLINVFSNRGILSLAANSKFIFALSKERKVLVFNITNGQKVASPTVSSDDILFGTIKCDEDNYYIVFGTKNETKFQAVHFSYDDDQLLYDICHPIFNFIQINNDFLLIMRKNEITLHNKSDGTLVESFLVPVDDLSIFKSKYINDKNSSKTSERSQYQSNSNEVLKNYIPTFAYLSNNNILFITTNSAIYRCRPILPIESYILNLKIGEEWGNKNQNQTPKNILFAAVEFARTISRENWIEFEKNTRSTSDPTLFAYTIISQYLNRDYKEFEELLMSEIGDQIDEIIDSLHLKNTIYDKNGYKKELKIDETNNPLSEFYRSACLEVIFAYSFFSRCIYFLVMFLTYKNKTAIYSSQLRKLSLLVHDYTQLSLIAEAGEDLPIELFDLNDSNIQQIQQEEGSSFDTIFIKTVIALISKLLDFDRTMTILMNHKMFEKVIEITSISNVPYVYYGLALLKLKRFNEAVDFFIQNSGFLADDKDLTEFVFQILRSNNRDDLIIRIGSLNSVAIFQTGFDESSDEDPPNNHDKSSAANFAALFRAYIKEKDYDSAFNCILTCQNETVKCDMLRVFISIMKKDKLRKRLFSYPFNTMISMFANELWCYSKDTLKLAISFFREIGDRYQATQAFYLYARCLLRNPTRENLGRAFTAMNLVLCQMRSNYEITIRDVGQIDQELTYKKLCRIISRTHCCLLLDDKEDDSGTTPENSTSICRAHDISFSRLLEIAAQRDNDVFRTALASARDDELINILPKLIEQNLILPLYELLSIKSESIDTCLVETTLGIYIKRSQVPPIFVIDKFIAKNVQALLMLCYVSNFKYIKYIKYDVILSLLHRKDRNKFFYLERILKLLKLPDKIIEKFRQ